MSSFKIAVGELTVKCVKENGCILEVTTGVLQEAFDISLNEDFLVC